MRIPPDSHRIKWLMCALPALAFCAAGMHAQEQSVQRRPVAPVTEVPSARLGDKYPARQQRRSLPDPPSMRYAELKKSAPARIVLPRLDTKPQIDEDEREIRNGERRIRGGVVRAVKISPEKDGEWIEVEAGMRVWRVEIVSPEARGLRLHLANVALGNGSQLFIYEGAPAKSPNVYESSNIPQSKEIFSSPTTAETVTVELVQKGDAGSSKDTLEIIGVGHLYRGVTDPTTIVPAGACNLDASCYPDWGHVGDAVGRTNYISGQYIYYCSGALINNSSGDFSPLFLTAAHCGMDSTTAASVNILWKYKTSSCNGPENYGPSTSGARFLATSPSSDSTLLEITGFLPDGLTWAGWSISTPQIGAPITGIHHPETSYRRISFGNTVLDDPNHPDFHSVRFSSGTVEPGSSGSPLFNDKQEIIGQLFGGNASCSNPSGATIYGKLATSFPQFKDANGSNYLESGLGDDRFGDISSRDKATSIQPGTINDLILRVGHDDWFRLNVPAYNVISGSASVNSYGSIRIEIYRNDESSPVYQVLNGNYYYSPFSYSTGANGSDIYYMRFFADANTVREHYSFNILFQPPPTPYITAFPPFNYSKLSEFIFTGDVYPSGATGTAWFEWTTNPDFSSPISSPPVAFHQTDYHVQLTLAPPGAQENTDYYFRLAATNGLQTVRTNIVKAQSPSGALSISPDGAVVFDQQRTGTTSAPQTLTITNTGIQNLKLHLLNPQPPFAGTSDCPISLPSGLSCHLFVTFTPVFTGFSSGGYGVDSSAGFKQLQFYGTGAGPIASVTFSDGYFAGFGNVLVGTSSPIKTFTLTNVGTYEMDLSHISVPPPIFQSNNCPSILAPAFSCTFQVSFRPNAPGSFVGSSLQFAPGNPGQNSVYLYGSAFDISLTMNRPARPSRGAAVNTIAPGQSAAYRVTLTPVGATNIPVSLSCSGAPAGVSCEVQPSAVTTGSGPVDVNVIVGVAGSPIRQSRSLRLRNVSLENAQSKSFNLNVTATIGAASRTVEIPVTITTTR